MRVGLVVGAALLHLAVASDLFAYVVDQRTVNGQFVNNTTYDRACHKYAGGDFYYYFSYTDSQYYTGRKLHLFIFFGAAEGEAGRYSVKATISPTYRGIAVQGGCVVCSCQDSSTSRQFYPRIEAGPPTTEVYRVSSLSYDKYASLARSLGMPVRPNSFAQYGHVEIDLSGGGSASVSNVSTGSCPGGICPSLPLQQKYVTWKTASNISIVGVPEEKCDDFVDNNGNGLVNEVCRGCSENGVQTGSTTELASGNLTQSVPLLAFDRRPTSLSLTAAYNSQDTEVGPLGRGWTHTYARRITGDNEVTLALVDAQGGYSFYRKEGADTYYPLTRGGTQDRIVKAADGTYERIFPDGGRWRFSAAGNLMELRDRTGRTITLTYTAGLLAEARDSVGRSFTFTYDANQRLVQVADSAGRTVSFAYDPTATYLTTIVDAGGGSWEFTYDADGRMATKQTPRGSVTAYAYDAQGRLTQVTDPRGVVKQLVYDPVQKTTQIIDAGGATRVQQWDGRLDVPLSVTDPTGRAVAYTYDTAGNRLTATDPAGGVTSYTYDSENRLLTSANPAGETTTLTYDPTTNQVASQTGPDGLVTSYTYDPSGNLLTSTDPAGGVASYAYDGHGNVTQVTNAAGQTTTFTYDALDQLVQLVDPAGVATTFAYDAAGYLREVTRGPGLTTTSVYDALGRLLSLTTPLGHQTTYTYDAAGNRLSQTDPLGRVTQYAYDARNAPILVTAPDGSETAYAYDDLGRMVSLTDANGRVTTYAYDAAGRLLSQTGPLGDVTTATYDARGQLATRTDPRGQQIEYRYDAAGRLVEKRLPDGTIEQHVYDSTGRLTSAGNATITYTYGYDSAGRLTSVTDSRGYVVGYGYDASSRRTTLTYPGGQVLTYGYDAAGRLALLSEASSGRTATFAYDTLGRRSRLDLPNGTRVFYTYDGGSRLVGLTHETSVGAMLEEFTYAYNAAGERTSETDLTATRAHAYDLVGRLTEVVETPAGSSQGQVVEAYTYDAVGNRLTGPGAADTSTYNAGHQLLVGPAASYTYDANGNRTVRSGGAGTTTYTWDPQDRLVQVSITPAQGPSTTVTFAYDHR
ncbi:MAG TPA: DUF6531 domain-containing protein, partial [Thermodesulfobacteriota bacterium]